MLGGHNCSFGRREIPGTSWLVRLVISASLSLREPTLPKENKVEEQSRKIPDTKTDTHAPMQHKHIYKLTTNTIRKNREKLTLRRRLKYKYSKHKAVQDQFPRELLNNLMWVK